MGERNVFAVIVFLFAIMANQGHAQDAAPADTHHCHRKVFPVDTQYIERDVNRMMVEYFIDNRGYSFELKSSANNGNYLVRWTPNVAGVHGFRFSYRSLTIGVGFKLPLSEFNARNYGNTDYSNLTVAFNKPKIALLGSWRRYRGMVDLNSPDYMPPYAYYKQADLTAGSLTLKGSYIFSPERFSYKAAYIYTERQLRSAGSWLLSGAFNLSRLRGDSSMVPAPIRSNFGENGGLQEIQRLYLGMGGGYAHTFVYQHFQLSLLLNLGLALQPMRYYLMQSSQWQAANQISLYSDLGASFSYNRPQWYIALQGQVFNDGFRIDDNISGNTSQLWFSFKVGWRPLAPAFVRRGEDFFFHTLQKLNPFKNKKK
jgi:hypothetical protein